MEQLYLDFKMSRNLSLDYLRNFANLSRCLLHAGIPYMVTHSAVWPVNESGSWFFDFAVFEIHLFVMELFFVIAGFVFAIQLQKKTIFSLFVDRTKRIFFPFVVGLLLLIPIVLSFFFLQEFSGKIDVDIIKNSYLKGWKLAYEMMYPTAHLWFLYYLLFFYVFTVFLRNFIQKLESISFNLLYSLSILISSICILFMQRWIVDNPLTLKIEMPSLIHYYLFFVLGLILYNSNTHLEEIIAKSRKFLIFGTIISLLAIIPQLFFEEKSLDYYNLIELTAIILYSTASYFLVFGFWGFFHGLTLTDSKILRYLTDSSYWVYIINMPFVSLIQILLIPLKISIFIKFIFSFFGALFLSLLSYEYLIRYGFIGQIINRKRLR